MQSLFILAICIIAISLVVIVIARIRLKNKSKELSERIATITSYRDIQEHREKELSQSNKNNLRNTTQGSSMKSIPC